ncbi:MAG: 4'-phosphopantetheinyl transferase superfamily protein [Pseudomonadota bacterium]|nr:4'-phosphopantetheinyl transferase superfamily protein [Pseudomonadota bacterium]
MISIDEQPLPANDAVHIWSLSLDDPELDLPELLSDDELARFSGINHPQARLNFLRSRSALRSILASYVRSPANELVFISGKNGKPELAIETSTLRFNLSHSSHRFLLSVAAECEIGIDIEQIQTNRDYTALARRFFTAEESCLIDSSDNDSLFYRMWVLKEAAVKARGMKLLAGLDRFECLLSENDDLKIRDKLEQADDSEWSVRQWQTDEKFVAAVMVRRAKVEFIDRTLTNL